MDRVDNDHWPPTAIWSSLAFQFPDLSSPTHTSAAPLEDPKGERQQRKGAIDELLFYYLIVRWKKKQNIISVEQRNVVWHEDMRIDIHIMYFILHTHTYITHTHTFFCKSQHLLYSRRQTFTTHQLVLGAGVDFVAVTVGVLLTSLLLLDDSSDVILQFIEETLLLPHCQWRVSSSGILGWKPSSRLTLKKGQHTSSQPLKPPLPKKGMLFSTRLNIFLCITWKTA